MHILKKQLPFLCVATLALGSCVSTQSQADGPFVPLERTDGQTLEGYSEALYDLSGTAGRFGEAKLWSRGAYQSQTGETLIQVSFDLENGSSTPITLDTARVRLESVQTTGAVLRDVPTVSPPVISTIAPNSTGRVELSFLLPTPVPPQNVRAFRVAWAVQSNGQEYSEFTPFARSAPKTYYVPVNAYYYPYYPYHYPYYNPFWYPRSRVVIIPHRYPRRMVIRGHKRR